MPTNIQKARQLAHQIQELRQVKVSDSISKDGQYYKLSECGSEQLMAIHDKNEHLKDVYWCTSPGSIRRAKKMGLLNIESMTGQALSAIGTYFYKTYLLSQADLKEYAQDFQEVMVDLVQDAIEALQPVERSFNPQITHYDHDYLEKVKERFDEGLNGVRNKVHDIKTVLEEQVFHQYFDNGYDKNNNINYQKMIRAFSKFNNAIHAIENNINNIVNDTEGSNNLWGSWYHNDQSHQRPLFAELQSVLLSLYRLMKDLNRESVLSYAPGGNQGRLYPCLMDMKTKVKAANYPDRAVESYNQGIFNKQDYYYLPLSHVELSPKMLRLIESIENQQTHAPKACRDLAQCQEIRPNFYGWQTNRHKLQSAGDCLLRLASRTIQSSLSLAYAPVKSAADCLSSMDGFSFCGRLPWLYRGSLEDAIKGLFTKPADYEPMIQSIDQFIDDIGLVKPEVDIGHSVTNALASRVYETVVDLPSYFIQDQLYRGCVLNLPYTGEEICLHWKNYLSANQCPKINTDLIKKQLFLGKLEFYLELHRQGINSEVYHQFINASSHLALPKHSIYDDKKYRKDDIFSATGSGIKHFITFFTEHLKRSKTLSAVFTLAYAIAGTLIILPPINIPVLSTLQKVSQAIARVMSGSPTSQPIAGGFTSGKGAAGLVDLKEGSEGVLPNIASGLSHKPIDYSLMGLAAYSIGYIVGKYKVFGYLHEKIKEEAGSVPEFAETFAGAKLAVLTYELIASHYSETAQKAFKEFLASEDFKKEAGTTLGDEEAEKILNILPDELEDLCQDISEQAKKCTSMDAFQQGVNQDIAKYQPQSKATTQTHQDESKPSATGDSQDLTDTDQTPMGHSKDGQPSEGAEAIQSDSSTGTTNEETEPIYGSINVSPSSHDDQNNTNGEPKMEDPSKRDHTTNSSQAHYLTEEEVDELQQLLAANQYVLGGLPEYIQSQIDLFVRYYVDDPKKQETLLDAMYDEPGQPILKGTFRKVGKMSNGALTLMCTNPGTAMFVLGSSGACVYGASEAANAVMPGSSLIITTVTGTSALCVPNVSQGLSATVKSIQKSACPGFTEQGINRFQYKIEEMRQGASNCGWELCDTAQNLLEFLPYSVLGVVDPCRRGYRSCFYEKHRFFNGNEINKPLEEQASKSSEVSSGNDPLEKLPDKEKPGDEIKHRSQRDHSEHGEALTGDSKGDAESMFTP